MFDSGIQWNQKPHHNSKQSFFEEDQTLIFSPSARFDGVSERGPVRRYGYAAATQEATQRPRYGAEESKEEGEGTR